jgi:hypothetical protein
MLRASLSLPGHHQNVGSSEGHNRVTLSGTVSSAVLNITEEGITITTTMVTPLHQNVEGQVSTQVGVGMSEQMPQQYSPKAK